MELYRAHIIRHAFEPHTHDAFGLGAIESGVERFRYRGADHLAPSGSVVLMNPDELHTGRAETEGGWRYRMAYIDADVVARVTGEDGWWFDTAVGLDTASAARVTALLNTLWRAREPLAFDSALHALLAEFRRHARVPRPVRAEGARFAPVIDYMRAHLSRRLTLEELAREAGLSPFHFLRSFQAHCHATPQQMLMALRLFEAKRRRPANRPPGRAGGWPDRPGPPDAGLRPALRRHARALPEADARLRPQIAEQARVPRRRCRRGRGNAPPTPAQQSGTRPPSPAADRLAAFSLSGTGVILCGLEPCTPWPPA